MGVLISANPPPVTSDYNNWKCYRSTTKTGSYSVINGANGQAITDLTYFDENGTSTSWYKISYYNTSSTNESDLSDPIQGQSTIYTTVKKVESLLQLADTTDSTSPKVQEIIEMINRKEDEIDWATGHAWRLRYSGTQSGEDTTQRYEQYDFVGTHEYMTGIPIYLKHREIRDMDASAGDALEFWDGDSWQDWLTDRTEGRSNDYWFDYTRGILYIRGHYLSQKAQAFRIKYRYGDTFLNRDIEDIATKMAAIDLLTGMDPRSMIVQEGGVMTHDNRVGRWRREVEKKMSRYKEFQVPTMTL